MIAPNKYWLVLLKVIVNIFYEKHHTENKQT